MHSARSARSCWAVAGKVNNPAGHVKLVAATPLLAGDRVTTGVVEDNSGATNVWSVTSYAVCAPRPAGYQVGLRAVGPTGLGAGEARAIVCPAGTKVHGAAAIALTLDTSGLGDTRGLALQLIYPFNALDRVQAFAVETNPVSITWEVRAVAICAACFSGDTADQRHRGVGRPCSGKRRRADERTPTSFTVQPPFRWAHEKGLQWDSPPWTQSLPTRPGYGISVRVCARRRRTCCWRRVCSLGRVMSGCGSGWCPVWMVWTYVGEVPLYLQRLSRAGYWGGGITLCLQDRQLE
jgi:hypothetical protein